MQPFTQSDLYSVLKPTTTTLDIPAFLRRAQFVDHPLYVLEEQFLTNLKLMVCETKVN